MLQYDQGVMEMPALNFMGLEIYFRIPKHLLYILKNHRQRRKINLGP